MTISLLYTYLQYDVEQLIEQYSRVWIADSGDRFEANLRSEEDNEADLIRRLIQTGCARLRRLLHRYIDKEPYEADNKLRNEAEAFYLGATSVDGQSMADLMHWYVVRDALSVWCKMQNHPKEADLERGELKELEGELLDTVRWGAMPKKIRTPKPDEPIEPEEPTEDDEVYTYQGRL